MDTAARRSRLWHGASDEAGIGALLITNPANVQWLTGLGSSHAAVLLLADRSVLATDSRYERAAADLESGLELVIARSPAFELVERAEASGQLALGVEERSVTLAQWGAWEEALGDSMPLVRVGPCAERLRAIKDSAEIELLRKACEISTTALAAFRDTVRIGESEITLARRLEAILGDCGADDRAFATIVASGPNSAIPHHRPTRREIRAGDLLLIDSGARVSGYHADFTRTFVVGAEPADWQTELHDLVESAAQAARAALAPGVATTTIDEAARALIAESQPVEAFAHGAGHGIGLEVHEAPLIGPGTEGMVEPGHVVTIEPGVYLQGRGGVRIEDVCVVDETGMEVLTPAPRALARIG